MTTSGLSFLSWTTTEKGKGNMTAHSPAARGGDLLQPVSAGLLASLVGFASSFPIVLQGLAGVGATPAEAASGLVALCLAQGIIAALLSWRWRIPVTTAWSTPGAALLAATGPTVGGFAGAVGAFVLAGLLVVLAGLWRPFGRAVSSIPMSLASGMLAGVLMELCLAPVEAVAQMPKLALPIIISWALAWRFSRRFAVPIAVLVTALMVAFATQLPAGVFAHVWPEPEFVLPHFSLAATIGVALPLFIVTMASQNVPGLAVMRVNGYNPPVRPVFVITGLGSVISAFFGGHATNLAAITAALCAGAEAHPDPARRWVAAFTSGIAYVALALVAGFAAAFMAASPPLLLQAVAGLALLGSLGAAFVSAFQHEDERLAAVITFVTTASGIALFGIGAAFWGLVAGGVILGLEKFRPRDGR